MKVYFQGQGLLPDSWLRCYGCGQGIDNSGQQQVREGTICADCAYTLSMIACRELEVMHQQQRLVSAIERLATSLPKGGEP